MEHAQQGPKEAQKKEKLVFNPPESGTYPEAVAKALVEILTGEPMTIRAVKIVLPVNNTFLILSATHPIYYRVTADHCPCAGWYWSTVKHGIGHCRHYRLAFPEQAKANADKIAELKAQKKAAARAPAPLPSPTELKDKVDVKARIEAVKMALQEAGLKVDNVRPSEMDSITIKVPFVDTTMNSELEAELDRQQYRILKVASDAVPGTSVYITSM